MPIDKTTPASEHFSLSYSVLEPWAGGKIADRDIALRVSTASSALKSGSMRFWIMIPSTAASMTAAIPCAGVGSASRSASTSRAIRSEEHTSELQSRLHLVCRLLLEKKKK